MAYIGAGQNKYTVFPIENYTFGNKAPKIEKQRGLDARFKHLKEKYAQEGMRRSVDGVVLVHKHNTIHVLLLQPNPSFFKLPGGKLKAGEDEISGLQRKLTRNLAPEKAEDLQMKWQVADCLGRFYRPNFETLLYPYCPTHIERPKEMKKLFLLNLPERAFLTVPRNMKLTAVPLFELHDHTMKYGPVISSLPVLLSRLHFTLAHSAAVESVPRPVAPPPDVVPAGEHQSALQAGMQQQQMVNGGAPMGMGAGYGLGDGMGANMMPPPGGGAPPQHMGQGMGMRPQQGMGMGMQTMPPHGMNMNMGMNQQHQFMG